MRGRVRETYHAAVQHDLVDLDGVTLVGVVRRPTGWFRSTVDENYPELGPPEDLLEDVKTRQDELKVAGMCDEEAHNAAWAETDFADRYREHLASSPEADARIDALADRVADGEDVALVCFEGEDKRCHRHALADVVEARVEDRQ